MFAIGKISVKAVLENKRREVESVYLLKGKKNGDTRYIQKIAKNVPIHFCEREQLDELCGEKGHGGYLAKIGKRKSDPIESLPFEKEYLSVLLVEGVRDPYNMGEILRTSRAMGFDALLTPSYDFYDNERIVIRSSAGASESMHWVESDDLVKDLEYLKTKGVSLVATHRKSTNKRLQDYQFPEKMCLMIGGAMRGLSREVLDMSDEMVKINYPSRMALSTVSSVAVFSYERYRQLEE